MIVFASVVLFQYWHLTDTLSPARRNTHFSILAVLLFSFTWILRNKFIVNNAVFFISELTYAVYLIHNWFFDYTKRFLMYFEINHPTFYSLVILILTSAVLVRLVERSGVRFGKKVINRLKKYNQEKGKLLVTDFKPN